MPILKPTDITARVVYLGVVRDRSATLESAPVEEMRLGWEGPEGECHGGATRKACSRVKLQYRRGETIRNTRQLSMLSAEELSEIAAAMGIPRVAPEWTGANIVFAGAPDFTLIPPASRLIFDGEDAPALAVDMENGPCRFVGEVIEARHPGMGMAFARVASGKRGVTGWVERPGALRLGDVARLHVPPQRLYQPAQRRSAAG